MRSIAIALALPFISSAQAVISVLYPRTDTIWYRNDTVNLNWTSSDPAADTFLFRAYLSNTDQSILPSQQGIADSTNATATFVRIALPQVQAAGGYIVTLVNTTNETQVFATSEAFQIEDGEIRTSSSSSSAGASRTVDIPNANTNTPFPSSFPSQPTGAAGHVANLASISPYVIGQTVGLAAMFIGGAAVLL